MVTDQSYVDELEFNNVHIRHDWVKSTLFCPELGLEIKYEFGMKGDDTRCLGIIKSAINGVLCDNYCGESPD